MPIPAKTPKNLRTFAIGILVITGMLAGLMLWRERETAAWVLSGFALWALVSVAIPKLIIPLFVVFSYIGLVLGWINTRIVLGLVFFLVFTPVGCCFRLFGKDPLKKRPDKHAQSYWREADPPAEPAHYERQF